MKGQIKGWNEGDTIFLYPSTTFLTIDNNNDNKKKKGGRGASSIQIIRVFFTFSEIE